MLLDSNILIYFAEPEGAFLRPWVEDQSACIAAVTRIETLGFRGWHRMSERQRAYLEASVMSLPALPLSASVIDSAIDLRRQVRIKVADAIIAATAIVHRLPAVTRNVANFRNIAGLEIIDPFAPA